MKKLILLFAVVLGFTAMTAMHVDTEPQFKFEKETYDFGKVKQGTPVTATLKFTNVGDKPLILSAVEPTCGCTVAEFTKTPIKKGATGSITLTYNAAAIGQFTKETTIRSNATEAVKKVYIKGEVVATVTSK
ncbi:DUF1573 domain-containing protein [Pedobacter frigiditerrae]|uniref:DUF1573 domain-containing protein n=1 Tax=Pedobacter frigiditerrae TaxID=2530452 RepID=A0A4R0MQM7_9SPHI|nr:DUF1573 domain-containing protein [Pedobacter frigiditerrae]TCC89160.1 DUF1573 domain-containing protein [Pedobacter frigiditerrae]